MKIIKDLQQLLVHPYNQNAKLRALSRIVLWKINQIFFRIPITIQITPQAKCICYPDSSFGSLIVYTKWPEHSEMDYIYSNLREKDIFIDVGANIGAMSLIAASAIKSGKVYSFEPTPLAITRLQENISLNNFQDIIEVIPKVVTNEKGSIKFSTSKISEMNHISSSRDTSNDTLTVKSTTLDSFIKEKKINNIKILKIDVEGSEYNVLMGAKKLLTGRIVDTLIIELNKRSLNYGHSNDDTMNLLVQHGYSLYQFNSNHQLIKLSPNNQLNDRTVNIIAKKKD